jgi:hypothetical protein
MMDSVIKKRAFIASFRQRLGPLVVPAIIFILLVNIMFADDPLVWTVGLDPVTFLTLPLIVVGAVIQSITAPTLLGLSSNGLELNWLEKPIAWSDVTGGRVIIVQGFSFGLSRVQLELTRELVVPIESDSHSLVGDGFVEWLRMQWRVAKNAPPVWEMVDPKTLQIKVSQINTTPEDLAKEIECYLNVRLRRN